VQSSQHKYRNDGVKLQGGAQESEWWVISSGRQKGSKGERGAKEANKDLVYILKYFGYKYRRYIKRSNGGQLKSWGKV